MLSDLVRNVLKAAACDLHRHGCDEMRIENDAVSGIIKTAWKTHSIEGRGGILFHAHIDCVDGSDYQVNFLFNQNDLELGADVIREMEERFGADWTTVPARIPIPELLQFENLRGPSRRVH